MPRNQHPRELDVAPGQRFRSQDGMVWEVSGFIRTHDGRPHVTLIKSQDKFTEKTISIDALFDKRLFSIVE
jgi:hypothetical protein